MVSIYLPIFELNKNEMHPKFVLRNVVVLEVMMMVASPRSVQTFASPVQTSFESPCWTPVAVPGNKRLLSEHSSDCILLLYIRLRDMLLFTRTSHVIYNIQVTGGVNGAVMVA